MIYEIKFGDANPLKFANTEKLVQWVKEELSKWSWLQSANGGLWNEFNQVLSNISANGTRLIANPENQGIINHLQGAINSFQSVSDRGAYIYSRSNMAEFIFSEMEDSPMFAARIAFVATRTPNQNIGNSPEILLAICALSEFQRGISKRGATASKKAFEQTRTELEALIKSEVIATEKRLEQLDDLIELREQKTKSSTETMASALGKQKSNTRDEQQKLRAETKDAADSMITTLKSELIQIKDFYESQIALQEPIQYWKDKSINHRTATYVIGGLFLLYSILVIWFLFDFILQFDEGIKGFIGFWKDASIGAFASFAGLIGLGMVFARILYRLFTSQLHLWNDSKERVVMIQTYLAMAQKEHVKDEFLGALLHRLFSPSADGIVKSDLGSVSALDMAMNKMGSS